MDEQQRLQKKNDKFRDGPAPKPIMPELLKAPNPVVEIDDFKDLLNLISDQTVKKVTLNEISIGNGKCPSHLQNRWILSSKRIGSLTVFSISALGFALRLN